MATRLSISTALQTLALVVLTLAPAASRAAAPKEAPLRTITREDPSVAAEPAEARPRASTLRIVEIGYRSHSGRVRRATVVVPADYAKGRDGAIPLVISPHGRGLDGRSNAALWDHLPALGRFAVVSPDGHGRRLPAFS